MSGDGLTDLVRVLDGEICYWPNLGHGRFGQKVTMVRAGLKNIRHLAIEEMLDHYSGRLATGGALRRQAIALRRVGRGQPGPGSVMQQGKWMTLRRVLA